MRTTTVTLGEVEKEIGLLPIGVLRELDAEFVGVPPENLNAKEKEIFFFDQCLNIILYALRTRDPTITLEQIKEIPSTMGEVFAAREKILRHAGLIVDRVPKVGEREAGAPLNGGGSSTAASAPDAVTRHLI